VCNHLKIMDRTYRHISVAALAPAIGAEVTGVDLSKPLAEDVFAEIRQAFLGHIALFFRDQVLTPDQQVAFASCFGPVGRYPFAEPVDGNPDVIAIIKEAHQTSNFGGIWHTDTTYLEQPSMGSMLYARQVPPLGGDTMWSNMYEAYDALSDGMKQMLSGLKGVNSAAKNKDALRMDHLEDGAMKGREVDKVDVQTAVHPVVRTHPETGRKSLYISEAHTICFEGMTEAESTPVLDFLYAHAIKEEFTCRFRWTTNTLAVWDNRCGLHYPLNDYHGHRREMHRITLQGDTPV
jgi:taurine dioxygenase